MRTRLRLLAGLTVAPVLGVGVQACESIGVEEGLDFERMVVQSRKDAYEGSHLFPDGMAMRVPPDGTVPYAPDASDPVVRTGRLGGEPVARAPTGYPLELLERGRDRFGIYCAPCHGFDGLGATPIAATMELKRPPPLLDPAIQARPDGHLFRVVGEGWGLMPGYASQLPVQDRWAVVGYVRALQLSFRVPLDSLPPGERERILERMGDGAASPAGPPPPAESDTAGEGR